MKYLKKLIATLMVIITFFTMFDYSVLMAEAKKHESQYSLEKTYEKEGYSVEFSITSQWTNGYSGNIRVYNTGEESIQNWYIGFDYKNEIINIWNGQIYYGEDEQYIIKNDNWNQDIAPDGYVEFGFIGLNEFVGFPENCELLQKRGNVKKDDYIAEFSVVNDWGNGYIGEISITNTSDNIIEDWELEVDLCTEIVNIWNGCITEKNSDLIRNADYNSNINPGQTVTIGFQGKAIKKVGDFDFKLYSYSPDNVEYIELSDGEIEKEYIEKAIYPQMILKGMSIEDVKLSDDFDNDGLTLLEEYNWDTNPFETDTDEDGLSDYEEVNKYFTNSIKWDTDDDGLGDGTEIQCGLNPFKIDTDNNGVCDGKEIITQTINVNYIENNKIETTGTLPYIEITGIGDYSKKIYTIDIENDDTILDIDCLVGTAFDFVHDDELIFDSSKLTFKISDELLSKYSINDLAIAWYNEQNNSLELLDTVVETDKSISAIVEHYSIYMVVSVSEYMYNIDYSNKSDIIETGKADVVFVVDTTGSMRNTIDNVKNSIDNFVTELENNKVDIRLGLVEYKDIYVDGINSTVNYGWFTYVSNFKNTLSQINVDGGGDTPETVVDALEKARQMSFRKNVDKYIVLITDADYHNGTAQNSDITLSQEISWLKKDGINISVITLPEYYDVYNELVEKTEGITANINNDFSLEAEELIDKMSTVSNKKCWVRLSNGSIVALDKNPSLGDDTVDTDGDGIPDIIELNTKTTTREFVSVNGKFQAVEMWTFYSNPVKSDTDGDGILDVDDLQPTKFDTTIIEKNDEQIVFNTGRMWNIMAYTAYDYLDYVTQFGHNTVSNKDITLEEIQEMSRDILANKEQVFSLEELTIIGLLNNEGCKMYMDDMSSDARETVSQNLLGRESKYFQHSGILWWSKWEEVPKGTEGGYFQGILISEADLNFSYRIYFQTDVYQAIDCVIVIGAVVISAILIAKAAPVVIANIEAIVYYVQNFGIMKGLEMYTYLGIGALPDGVISWIQMDISDGDSSLDDLVDAGIPIYQRGISGEKALAQQYQGQSQVYYNTAQYGFKGGRYVDQLSKGVAYEAKVGYTCLSNRVKIQIQKDACLLEYGEVNDVVWVFYRSDITGRVGATQSLLDYLTSNGISYIIQE